MQILTSRASVLSSLALILAAACGSSSPGTPPDAPPGSPIDASDPTPDTAEPGPDAADPTPDASPDAPPDGSPDAPPDAPPNACVSPFTVTPDPGAEAAATAALHALDPAATLEWAPLRGTLARINGLVISLPECTGSKSVYDELFRVLAQSPALFQIDASEWSPSSAITCQAVLDGGFQNAVIRRTKYGPYPLANDVFRLAVDRREGVVIFRSFSAFYLPPPSATVLGNLAECPDKTDAELTAAARVGAYHYQTFAPAPAPFCSIDGDGSYTTASDDIVTLDPSVSVFWEEGDAVTLHRERVATVLVFPTNHTPDLIRSDANCPGEDPFDRIGWQRTFDTTSGAVLRDRPSPDPTCTVCLK